MEPAGARNCEVPRASAEAIPRLVELLEHPSPEVREQCARLLGGLSDVHAHNSAVVSAGAVPRLVGLLRDPSDGVRHFSLWALRVLARYNVSVRTAALSNGALPLLLELLGDASAEVRELSIGVLLLISTDVVLRKSVVAASPIPHLVRLLDDPSPFVQQESASLLGRLASENLAVATTIVSEGAIPALVRLMGRNSSTEMRDIAAFALIQLTEIESANLEIARTIDCRAFRDLSWLSPCFQILRQKLNEHRSIFNRL